MQRFLFCLRSHRGTHASACSDRTSRAPAASDPSSCSERWLSDTRAASSQVSGCFVFPEQQLPFLLRRS